MVEEIEFMDTRGGYGAVAVKAVELLLSGKVPNQKYAWDQAANKILNAKSSKEKGCPKVAFLGLCEEGFIKGILCGSYTNSMDNKRYALKAVQILKKNPDLSHNTQQLWNEVMKLESKNIQHSGQMDVVVTLWKEDLIDV